MRNALVEWTGRDRWKGLVEHKRNNNAGGFASVNRSEETTVSAKKGYIS
jgi:hypothetical protein